MNKYNWKGINLPLEKDGYKKYEKTFRTSALNVFYVEKKYIQFMFQNITQYEENKLFF